MNIIYKNNKLQFYESIWRNSIISKKYDIDNKLFPFPKKSKKKLNNKYMLFMKKLKKIERVLIKQKKYKKYKKKQNCLITDRKNIGDKIFNLFSINWDNTLLYYMKNFNIIPSNDFYNFIKHINFKNNKLILQKNFKYPFFKLKGIIYKKYKNQYLVIKKNQLRILDALYEDGSNKLYKSKDQLKYSEHSGLIDFNINSIDRIIVNAKNNYIDHNDNSIFLPRNMIDEADYELIFHTHPKTKDRLKDKIIFEFPSISDLLNFGENYNDGYTQGSLIIAPEGAYIIQAIDNNYDIKLPTHKIVMNLEDKLLDIHLLVYKKYKKKYNTSIFYNKIIKDHTYITLYNKLIKKYNLYIKYISRIKYKKNYIIPDIYLKLNIIESKNI